MKNICGFFLAFLFLLPMVPSSFASNAASSGLPTLASEFRPSECEFELPPNLVEGRDVNCGYLSVPENYNDPEGKEIRLAVAIINSLASTPEADPLFMEQGGPGGSTIDTFLQQFSVNSRLRANRDIVLLEQRGTLYSSPSLVCPEIDQMTLDTLEKDLTQEEAASLSLQAAEACHDRLAALGVELSAFDSLENAQDLESLRQALGYEKINLYGVSYGTLLALHYLKMYPQSLRSLILDGVLPPQINFLLQTTSTIDQSLKNLFEACQADADCQRDYPALEKTFFELVEKFNETPATFPMTDPDSGITYQAVLDGDSFMNSIAQMLYGTSIIPALPRVIYDARAGEFGFLSRILTLILFDRTLAYGMYYSVLCAEDADFSAEEQELEGVNPAVVQVMERGPQDFLDTCKMWKVENLDSSVDLPVSSDVPVLLLSGAFDPVTPPEYAQASAETLNNATLVTFPNGGHGQAFEGECQDQIILDFLENPNDAPDTSCVDGLGGPDFYTSRNLINAPFVIDLINLEQFTLIEFLILTISALFLFSAVIIIPISGIIRWLSKPRESDLLTDQLEVMPRKTRAFPSRLIGWLAFFVGLLALLFVVGLVATIAVMVVNNDNRLLYGLAGEARPWLILPPLILVLSLTWLVGLIQAWRLKAGSIASRIYHSFLITNAVVFLTILVVWGMLLNVT